MQKQRQSEDLFHLRSQSTAEKVPVTKAQSTTLSIRKPTVSATKSRITAGVCALTALYGSATATASDVNTTPLVTLHLWINRSRTATAPSAIIFLTARSQWTRSSLTVCCWSSFFARLRELDPEADTIIQLWQDHPEGISDRAIARKLGRPQKTFADQMKKYRTDLRRIAGDK